MLLSRVLTGIVLAVTVALTVLYLNPLAFALFFGVFAGAGAYEWAGFFANGKRAARIGYVLVFVVLATLLYQSVEAQLVTLYIAAVVWGLAIAAVLSFPRSGAVLANRGVSVMLGMVVVCGAWVSLVVVSTLPEGRIWLIWLVFVTSLTDIGAYFSGRLFGKRALAPRVSPAKTWEGAVGGALLSSVLCGTAVALWQNDTAFWWPVMGGLIVLAVFGDLFESVMKRATGIKDSGNILPGHGGILDRMDSVLPALPVMALVLHG
jgi:phosphatidate cytidylyltransferase